MEEKVIDAVHNTHEHRGKLCRCRKCGIVRRCSPYFDFYVRTEDAASLKEGAFLYCINCVGAVREEAMKRHAKGGIGYPPSDPDLLEFITLKFKPEFASGGFPDNDMNEKYAREIKRQLIRAIKTFELMKWARENSTSPASDSDSASSQKPKPSE